MEICVMYYLNNKCVIFSHIVCTVQFALRETKRQKKLNEHCKCTYTLK
jgi:hypothetical protein